MYFDESKSFMKSYVKASQKTLLLMNKLTRNSKTELRLNSMAVILYYKNNLKKCKTKEDYKKLIAKIEKNIKSYQRAYNGKTYYHKKLLLELIDDHTEWLEKVKEEMKRNT